MYATVAAIKAKYANSPPPDDWPLYGDTIVFKDMCNGRVYQGVVLRHSAANIHVVNRTWEVEVATCVTTGEDAGTKRPVFNVHQTEIVSITRAGEPGALTKQG